MEKTYQAGTNEGIVDFINMEDLEIAASQVIPAGGYGYISSGAGDLFTYQENRSEERRVGKECRSRWSPYL